MTSFHYQLETKADKFIVVAGFLRYCPETKTENYTPAQYTTIV